MQKDFRSWGGLALVTLLAAYAFIFNEWLFSATKPSYLNKLAFAQQVEVYLLASALLAGLCLLALLPLAVMGLLPPLRRFQQALIWLGGWLPALIFALLALMLVDNFTYTLFKVGVVTSQRWVRGVYAAAFVLAAALCLRQVLRAAGGWRSQNARLWPKAAYWLLSGVALLTLAALIMPDRLRVTGGPLDGADQALQRPHILLITPDGVNAENMSVYGYERDTTPRLRQLAETALVADNAFTNSEVTAGSIISIYTGKYPAQTRVLYPPDYLPDADAYQHLPGLLRAQGYRTVQITLPHYLDAGQLNLLEGFDQVYTSSGLHSKYLNSASRVLPTSLALFIDEVFKRSIDRLRHIFFIQEMDNPYLLVTGPSEPLGDIERMEMIKQELAQAEQPVFIHAHLMSTHGSTFRPLKQVFSGGQPVDGQAMWAQDFYDDSILTVDSQMGDLVDYLERQGLLESTILILASDHGQQWTAGDRLPLIMRFPGGQHAGRVNANAQNLDIAPTLLDYIGLPQPDWMPGASLIAGTLAQRPIFAVSVVLTMRGADGDWVISPQKVTPPFYQFGAVQLIYCQDWFRLTLDPPEWQAGQVIGSTSQCPAESLLSEEQAYQLITAHLRENSFDISSLPPQPPPQVQAGE